MIMHTGSPPSPATDTGVESLEESTAVAPEEKAMEDDKQQQQQASKLNLEPSASLACDSLTSPPSSPEIAKSADMMESESVHDDTIPAEDQSKGQTSPVVTSPGAKPRLLSAESAETTFAKWAKDDYVVSIPLSLVRLSRKSKSRSSSKDLGGKLHVHVYTTCFLYAHAYTKQCMHMYMYVYVHWLIVIIPPLNRFVFTS